MTERELFHAYRRQEPKGVAHQPPSKLTTDEIVNLERELERERQRRRLR